jgi:outer membrane protein OmpU
MGVVSTAAGDAVFSNRVRIEFKGTGTTDGGLAFGGTARADNAVGANAGVAGSAFISGAFGKISMGDVSGGDAASVGQLASVGWDGAGYGNSINYASDGNGGDGGLPGTMSELGAARVSYSYAAGSVTVNASTSQLTNGGASASAIGASFTSGALTVGVGYGAVTGLSITGYRAYDSNTQAGLAVAYAGTGSILSQAAVAAQTAGFYETRALDASITDMSLSAAYVMDNTTIKAIYQTKTVEATADARTAVAQTIVNTTTTAPVLTAAIHGHGAISLSAKATSMGLSVVQKMDALTLTAYGINTTVDADADMSADNPTVSRYGIGFGYDLGGGASIAGGWAKADAMVSTPIVATTNLALETHTLTSVSADNWDLGLNFSF